MEINNINNAIQGNRINITQHARYEAINDLLDFEEILISTNTGEIIENYPYDKPYPSCLIYGKTSTGDPIHTVWAYDSESKIAILITVYRPDENVWINYQTRKKT